MTAIAWDGHTLAADRLVQENGARLTTTKVQKINGLLVAACGCADYAVQMMEWVRQGRIASEFPKAEDDEDDTSLIVIEPGPRICVYQKCGFPVVIDDPWYTDGAGRHHAAAALYLGCDAHRAVEVACALHVDCGGGIDTVTFE